MNHPCPKLAQKNLNPVQLYLSEPQCAGCDLQTKCTFLYKFRLNKLSELDDLKVRMGETEFYNLAHEVYRTLDSMKPGQMWPYQKKYKDIRLEAVVKFVCRYILDHPDYEFWIDYSYVRKVRI